MQLEEILKSLKVEVERQGGVKKLAEAFQLAPLMFRKARELDKQKGLRYSRTWLPISITGKKRAENRQYDFFWYSEKNLVIIGTGGDGECPYYEIYDVEIDEANKIKKVRYTDQII